MEISIIVGYCCLIRTIQEALFALATFEQTEKFLIMVVLFVEQPGRSTTQMIASLISQDELEV
jgi:hypothetical protein